MKSGLLLLTAFALLPVFRAGAADSTVLEEDFSRGMADWYVEGGRSVAVRDGRLEVDADPAEFRADGGTGGFCTVWHRRELSGDLEISFDVGVIASETGTNNINFFLFYTGPDGESPERTTGSRRMAVYRDYHELPGYIFTFLNAAERRDAARFRIRRCPGFRLLNETYGYHNRAGRTYRVTIRKIGGHLEIRVDGELRLSAEDPKPLSRGWFGFRTFRTRLWFDRLRITRPAAGDASSPDAKQVSAPPERPASVPAGR